MEHHKSDQYTYCESPRRRELILRKNDQKLPVEERHEYIKYKKLNEF